MKHLVAKIAIMYFVLFAAGAAASAQTLYPNLADKKELVIKRGVTKEALGCIECHAKKMPGTVEAWKLSHMSHAGISCYDCHVVEKSSPMASQCEGVRGTDTYISPMVSSKTCQPRKI